MQKLRLFAARWRGVFVPFGQWFRKAKYMRSAPRVRFFAGSRVYDCRFGGYNALRNGSRLTESELGEGSYLNEGACVHRARIGRWCSIADGVKIGLGSHPLGGFVSTSGLLTTDTTRMLGFTIHRGEDRIAHYPPVDKGYTAVVGNDVWIGSRALILDGVRIGDGAVVGAGAVVTRDVEPYTVVVGVPARPLRKRFTERQIAFLLRFRWWDKGAGWVAEHYAEMEDIEEFMKRYDDAVEDME
jgi:acetyltransferase-like isoleucine patch superfamily enzyme